MNISIFEFLNQLKSSNIYFNLNYIRENAIMIEISVPGQRWEVEFFANGTVEVERFRSENGIEDPSVLSELFKHFSD